MLPGPLEPKQYTAIRYAERLTDAGAVASIGTVGDSYDKALSSHCTSWGRLGQFSVGEASAHALDEAGILGRGRFEQLLVLVVGLMAD